MEFLDICLSQLQITPTIQCHVAQFQNQIMVPLIKAKANIIPTFIFDVDQTSNENTKTNLHKQTSLIKKCILYE